MMKSQQLMNDSGVDVSGFNRDLSKKSTNVGDTIPIDTSVNHYELPNLAQLLYDYTNKEQELIQRCFRTGNYNSLREIPNKIQPNVLLKFLKKKMDQNLQAKMPTDQKKLVGGGFFNEFEWLPDSYDNWKYQDCFINDNDLRNYVFPFLNIDDPYEATKEEILRAKWLEENKILHGDFKPAQADKAMERVTKQQLPDIVNYIKKVIMIDWAEVNFIIGTNPDSFIEIKFDQKSIDTDLGLKAYMNTMLTTHEVVSQFNLKRVLKFWGFRDEKHVYFMLAPSWIKFNPSHVYHSVLSMQQSLNSGKGLNNGEKENDENNANKSVSTNNLYKMSYQLNKSSNQVKDPQLYSKDIDI
eukprot:403357524